MHVVELMGVRALEIEVIEGHGRLNTNLPKL